MKAFYSDHFVLPLPEGHRFPMAKYSMLRERVATELAGVNMLEAPAATLGELALVHDPDYVKAVQEGTLSPQALREIGFPWSPAMAERSRGFSIRRQQARKSAAPASRRITKPSSSQSSIRVRIPVPPSNALPPAGPILLMACRHALR